MEVSSQIKNSSTHCKSPGITVKTTVAESPWGNSMVKRHNLVLQDMLDKILEDIYCIIDFAVAW